MRRTLIACLVALAGCSPSSPRQSAAQLPEPFARAAESAGETELPLLLRAAAEAPEGVTMALVGRAWVAYQFTEQRPDGLYLLGRTVQFDENAEPLRTITVEERRAEAPALLMPADDLAAESTEWLTYDLITTFIDAAYNRDRTQEAIDSLVAPDVINHTAAGVSQGREAFAAYINGPDGLRAAHDPQAIAVQNDLAAIMSLVITRDAGVERRFMKFDVLRFVDGQIAEHWVIVQPV